MLEVWEGLPMLFMLIILASFVEPTFGWLLGLMILLYYDLIWTIVIFNYSISVSLTEENSNFFTNDSNF